MSLTPFISRFLNNDVCLYRAYVSSFLFVSSLMTLLFEHAFLLPHFSGKFMFLRLSGASYAVNFIEFQ